MSKQEDPRESIKEKVKAVAMTPNKILLQTIKLAKIGKKFNLKSVEVNESFIKIEFNDVSTPNLTKKPSKRDKQVMEEVKEIALLEEMQLLDPEAYEEELVKRDGGLKEI